MLCIKHEGVSNVTLSEQAFTHLISERARYLLSVANHLPKHRW